MPKLSLDSLPVELLWEIFIYSCSPSLPLASHHFYSAFKNAPASIPAEYILNTYLNESKLNHMARIYHVNIISWALRFPVCNRQVLDAIFRSPIYPERTSSFVIPKTQLPRRLFRSLVALRSTRAWMREDAPLPFLEYLFSHSKIENLDVDSWDGYALVKAVAAGFVPLVRFLLDKGASPARKHCLAVMVAIQRKDLSLVRMLVEPQASYTAPPTSSEGPSRSREAGRTRTVGKRKVGKPEETDDGRRSAKRRKIEDRVQVNAEMLKAAVRGDARDIVNYLMVEKCVAPDMQTVLMMK